MLLLLLLDEEVQTTSQSTTDSEAKDHVLQVEQVDVAVMDVNIIIGGDILDKVVQLPSPSMIHHKMKRHFPFHPTLALVCTIPSLHQFGHGTTSPFLSPDSSLSSQLSTPTSTSSMTILNHLPTLGIMLIILSSRTPMFWNH